MDNKKELKTSISLSVQISNSPEYIWNYLTIPQLMCSWMLEDGMSLNITTDWKEGSPIHMQGVTHGLQFEVYGKVLTYKFPNALSYSHLSSLSQLSDSVENYAILNFNLQKKNEVCLLTLQLSNFKTYEIYKHLEFYWKTALQMLKLEVEKQNASSLFNH